MNIVVFYAGDQSIDNYGLRRRVFKYGSAQLEIGKTSQMQMEIGKTSQMQTQTDAIWIKWNETAN